MARRKTHLEDIRLSNNAGMSFPLCFASQELLDLSKTGLPMTGHLKEVTCGNCLKRAPKRYPWAYARHRAGRL